MQKAGEPENDVGFPKHNYSFAQVKSMDDNCGEWVECMGVACGCS